MFIHKYTIGEDTFYRVSKAKAGPSKIVTVTKDDWKGVSAGSNVQNAIKFLSSLKFSKDIPEEKEEERKASLASMVRSIISKSQEAI
jgi:hypothetical protein